MVHDSVKGIIEIQRYQNLVTRDTENRSLSDRYKSAIEELFRELE